MSLTLFDLDRTLVREDTAGLFIRYEYEAGLTSAWRVARVMWWRGLYTLGLIDAARIAQHVLGWYRGRTEDELRFHTARLFEQSVRPLISEEARRTVKAHQDSGDRVIIVTASTSFIAEIVAQDLGIAEFVCTELEVRDGKLTGRLNAPLCYGAGKIDRLRDFLGADRDQLESATFYTDSITDLPLLEATGNPIVVNPDPPLLAVASTRGWPILRW